MNEPTHATTHRRRNRPWRPAAAAAAAVLLLGACSSSSRPASSPSPATSGSATPSGASVAVLTISGYAFHPAHLTVSPGERIKVTNEDPAPHTLTAKAGAGLFSTGNLSQGQSATIVAPNRPGDYPFYCEVHVFMAGTLTVA